MIMIFLWIILAFVLLITFILLLRVRLVFDYHQKHTITLCILWFRFDGNQLINSFAGKSGKKKKNEKDRQIGRQQKNRKQKPTGDLLGFIEFLGHIASVLGSTLKDYLSKTRVCLKELCVSIGTDDAARTALLCSSAVQAANGLCAVLQRYSKFSFDSKNLNISPNFTSEESKFSIHLVLSSSIFHLIGVYLRANMRFFN